MSSKIFLCNLPRDLHGYILKWGNFCYNGICQYLSKLHFGVPNQSCGCTIIWNFVIRLFQNALCMKYIEKYEKGIIMHEDKNILSLTLTHQRGFSYQTKCCFENFYIDNIIPIVLIFWYINRICWKVSLSDIEHF